MNYYSDPTASMALGNIGREFSKLEKKAKKMLEQYDQGKITKEALEQKAKAEFKGIYRHVLSNVEKKELEKKKSQ